MAEDGVAEALLRERLPRRFARELAGPPTRLSEQFVSKKLRGSVADLVLEAPLRGGEPLTVCCLVEHKRTNEARLLFQVVGYMVALYERLLAEGRKALPPIVALVVYNGTTRWRGPRRLSQLVKTPAWLRRYALDFEVIVVDVGAEPVEKLSRHRTLKGGLVALKVATVKHAKWQRFLNEVVLALRPEGSTLDTFVSYLEGVVGKRGLPMLRRALQSGSEEKQMVGVINEFIEEIGRKKGLREGRKKWLEKGREEGIEKGIERGREEALRQALTSVLTKRFKKVPDSVAAKVASADARTLQGWLDAAILARSLRSVFASH
jgi:predicted transposase/invertase (TIGR01784 family)